MHEADTTLTRNSRARKAKPEAGPEANLIRLCRRVMAGLEKQVVLSRDGRDADYAKRDVISAKINPLMDRIEQTNAATLAEIRAKALLYKDVERPELAASIAADLIRLAA
jgi:hypothetical protein